MCGRVAFVGVMALSVAGCNGGPDGQQASPPVVGAWLVKIPDAPFPLHVFVFHSDGTVEQSNPDAGDPNTSDSNLMGAWRAVKGRYQGRMVEITADRATHQVASRGEIAFDLKIGGNTFDGTASATFFDPDGRRIRGPMQVRMEGERIQP